MTDQTKCPHCGAEITLRTLLQVIYQCGSRVMDSHFHQSMTCDVLELRAKVAAQQELLKEAAEVISEAVFVLEWGEDWESDKVKKLEPLHRKISATL